MDEELLARLDKAVEHENSVRREMGLLDGEADRATFLRAFIECSLSEYRRFGSLAEFTRRHRQGR